MFFRLIMLIMVATQLLFFVSGCEQLKEYRKKSYYEKARDLHDAQDYRGALKQLAFALEFDEEYVDAIVLRGECLYELKQYKQAALSFRHSASLVELDSGLVMKAADSYLKGEKAGLGLGIVGQGLAMNSDDPQLLCMDVRLRLRTRRLDQWKDVEDIIQPVLDNPEYRDVAFALLAEFYILNNNLEKADQILMEYARLNDDWLFSMRMLAKRYGSLNDYQAIVRIYRKILELKPDSTQDIDSLLFVFRKFKRKDEEEQFLVHLAATDGEHLRYTMKLVRFYMHYGHFAEAEELILEGIERETRRVEFIKFLIEVYRKTDRHVKAIQECKDLLSQLDDEMEDVEIEFMSVLAWLYYETNNSDLAKVVVRWLLDLDPGNSSARLLLARIALDEGRTLLAIAEFRGLVSEDLDNPDYDYYIGLAHLVRKEPSNAEQAFRQALKKDPSHKQSLLEIADLYFEQEDYVEMERRINEFLALNPDDRDVLALQAKLAEKIGPPVPSDPAADLLMSQ